MKDIIEKHFLPFFNLQTDFITTSYKYNSRKEDWFLLNILKLLDDLKSLNIIDDIEIEKDEIDLLLKYKHKKIYCELKNWLDKQKDKKNKSKAYRLSTYLSPKSKEWKKDFAKLLSKNQENVELYFIIFYCADKYDSKDDIIKSIKDFIDRENGETTIKYEIYFGERYYIISLKIKPVA